nr:MAG TPA: hypothetical protein [Caudoviricetes sp.]
MFIILCPIYRARDDKQPYKTYKWYKNGEPARQTGSPFSRHSARC